MDLDAFTGASIKLRFFFDSLDLVANYFDGWFVDDVEVTAGGCRRTSRRSSIPCR